MTGFGRCEVAEGGIVVTLQVSSVNRKNLEIVCSLPKELQQLERVVTERVRSKVSRGRLQFSMEIRSDAAAAGGLPSDAQMDAALERLKRLASRYDSKLVVDGTLLTQVAALLEEEASGLDADQVEPLLLRAVDQAMDELVAMREREGLALKADLAARKETLVTCVQQVKELAPGMVSRYRELLFSRLEQAGLELDINDDRVLREIALFADRCDISEEITRLDSHFEQFAQYLEQADAVGRPMEFLLQEVAREINTTGSKASVIEISKLVLEMKNELERIREQVANVE